MLSSPRNIEVRRRRTLDSIDACQPTRCEVAPKSASGKSLGRVVGVPSLWPRRGRALQQHGLGVIRQVDLTQILGEPSHRKPLLGRDANSFTPCRTTSELTGLSGWRSSASRLSKWLRKATVCTLWQRNIYLTNGTDRGQRRGAQDASRAQLVAERVTFVSH